VFWCCGVAVFWCRRSYLAGKKRLTIARFRRNLIFIATGGRTPCFDCGVVAYNIIWKLWVVWWYCGVMVLRCYGVMVLRCCGVMVLRCYSVTVLRCFGVAVLRCFGVLVLRCFGVAVFWCFGVLVFWCCGAEGAIWLVRKGTIARFRRNLIFIATGGRTPCFDCGVVAYNIIWKLWVVWWYCGVLVLRCFGVLVLRCFGVAVQKVLFGW
jgi:hypothetical protein